MNETAFYLTHICRVQEAREALVRRQEAKYTGTAPPGTMGTLAYQHTSLRELHTIAIGELDATRLEVVRNALSAKNRAAVERAEAENARRRVRQILEDVQWQDLRAQWQAREAAEQADYARRRNRQAWDRVVYALCFVGLGYLGAVVGIAWRIGR